MISPRRSGFLLGLAMVVGVPSLASAQLFPDLPIRRQRPDCSQENPQYKVIRQEYWGYYPTCWRKFPPGWGCPSPEAPNWEAEKQRLKLVPLERVNSTKPEVAPPLDNRPNGDRPGDGMDRQPVRPKPGDTDVPPIKDDAGDLFNPKPKPPAGTNPKPADPFTDPPADPPKPPGTTTPAPLGDTPPTTAAPSRRGRGLVAGLFGRRN